MSVFAGEGFSQLQLSVPPSKEAVFSSKKSAALEIMSTFVNMRSIFKTTSTVSSDESTLLPGLPINSVGLTILHPIGDSDGFALVE